MVSQIQKYESSSRERRNMSYRIFIFVRKLQSRSVTLEKQQK